MKDTLNYLEIHVLTRELQSLIGARVDKIYNPSENEILMYLYSTKLKKILLRIAVPYSLVLTEYKTEKPEVPSHFCMFLRKYLIGARVTKVVQPKFERIVEIHFEHNNESFILINELFSKGNIIICDKDYNILIPLKAQVWRDRTIRAKERYDLPPRNLDLANIDFTRFKEVITTSGKDEIVKSIAIMLGIGGTYAEEICLRAHIDKTKPPKSLNDSELRLLFKTFIDLTEKSESVEIKPYLVYADNILVDVQPFELEIYKDSKKEYMQTFDNAVDLFFVKQFSKRLTTASSDKIELSILKQEALLKSHKAYLEETNEKIKELKQKGELIYQNYDKINNILESILDARNRNISWADIINEIEKRKNEGNELAQLIKSISHNTGVLTIDMNSGVEIDITKNLTQNANDYFEQSKKLQGKLDGISNTIEDVENKIKELKESKENISETVSLSAPKQIEQREKLWYQRFVWMITSNGKLVVGGRDSTQNEILMKKYVEENDLVLHADVHGSPFTLIKGGKIAKEEDIREAAEMTLCHSKAWQNKIISEVYWVLPHQISKKAPAGEYIGRGAFMVYGKKNYLKDLELRYAIGLQIEPFQIVSGPVDNVRRKAKYYAVILPGKKDKDTLSKDIKAFMLKNARESDKELINSVSIEEIKEHAIQNSDIFGLIE
jgi:predicted ribosome quality control (RQC) complex YloA/Tae2 family protein